MQYPEPTFPIPKPPPCRSCGCPGDLIPAARRSNPIGNASRRYYICSRGGHRGGHADSTWITFDDAVGILQGNPRCDCGFTSRLSSRSDGDGQFYCCPVGRCPYRRNGPGLPAQMADMHAQQAQAEAQMHAQVQMQMQAARNPGFGGGGGGLVGGGGMMGTGYIGMPHMGMDMGMGGGNMGNNMGAGHGDGGFGAGMVTPQPVMAQPVMDYDIMDLD